MTCPNCQNQLMESKTHFICVNCGYSRKKDDSPLPQITKLSSGRTVVGEGKEPSAQAMEAVTEMAPSGVTKEEPATALPGAAVTAPAAVQPPSAMQTMPPPTPVQPLAPAAVATPIAISPSPISTAAAASEPTPPPPLPSANSSIPGAPLAAHALAGLPPIKQMIPGEAGEQLDKVKRVAQAESRDYIEGFKIGLADAGLTKGTLRIVLWVIGGTVLVIIVFIYLASRG